MRCCLITLLWVTLFYPTIRVSKADAPKLIRYKENLAAGRNAKINTSPNDFKDFVRNSEVFVDKSLLINLLAGNVSFVSLTYPRKWGKTINLDMLKTFLEIEVDAKGKLKSRKTTWSYKFFHDGEIIYEDGTSVKLNQPPLISANKKLINSYLGQYPVVYVTFAHFEPVTPDFKGYFRSFQNCIADAFRRHEYLVDAFQNEIGGLWTSGSKSMKTKELLEKFNQYLNQQVNSEKGMITSLEFLSDILKSYFNQRVYILMDDYDVLVHEACFGECSIGDEVEKILNFYQQFMLCTFETNYENARMGIVTGMLDLNLFANHSKSFTTVNYNLFDKNTQPPFGFTKLEVNELLMRFQMNEMTVKGAIDHYGAYHVGDAFKMVVYDPWLFVNFARSRTLSNFRSADEGFGLPSILRCDEVRQAVEMLSLTIGSPEVGFRNLTFSKEDLIASSFVTSGMFTLADNKARDAVLKYLCAVGYFQLHNFPTGAKIELVNDHVASTLRKRLGLDFEGDMMKSTKRITELIYEYFHYNKYEELEPYFNENTGELEKLHKRSAFSSHSHFYVLKDFHWVHLMVLYHMRLSFNYDGSLNRSYHDGNDVLRPYIVLQKPDHRVIIEFECLNEIDCALGRKLAKKALNRAIGFNAIFKNKPTVRTSFIGIALHTGNYVTFTFVAIDTNPICH